MAAFTVHQPPPGKTGTAPDPTRFVFVRDGFYLWGFLLSVLWMWWHRLWLASVLFIALSVLMEVGLRVAGVGEDLRTFAFLLLCFLVGLEGGSLRRWTLARRGWTNVGVTVAEDQDEAERRFFVNWQNRQAAQAPARAENRKTESNLTMQQPHTGQSFAGQKFGGDVIGSFPQPEPQR